MASAEVVDGDAEGALLVGDERLLQAQRAEKAPTLTH